MNPFTMRSKRLHLITAALACFIFFGCDKKTEEFTSASLSDYLPLQVGKYITYRLDSTVFTNFGTVTVVKYYQEKQIVDAKITDALGRDSYRILRFLRDTAATQPWAPAGTYSITPTDKTIEVIENNLRFVKLVMPVKQDFTWKGNNFLADKAFGSIYSFDIADAGMADWDYSYSSTESSMVLKGQTFNNVLTVDVDISDPFFNTNFDPNSNSVNITNTSSPAYATYLQDNYAQGIGLIYQRFIMWEYQPPNGSNQTGAKIGFGVKRSIIDHN